MKIANLRSTFLPKRFLLHEFAIQKPLSTVIKCTLISGYDPNPVSFITVMLNVRGRLKWKFERKKSGLFF